MLNLDYTVLVQMANFILLILILNVLLYKPLLAVMEKRKQQMDESDGEVKHLSQLVEQKLTEYEEKVRLAKLGAIEQRNVIVKEGVELAKSTIDAVRSEIPVMMDQFNVGMGREVDAARAVLHSQSQKISLEIAEKVLGRSIQ